VVGEDWQLSRRCPTRCFAVLVELRVVGEMAIFANHQHCGGRYSLPHPLIRFFRTYPTHRLSDPSPLQQEAPSVPLNVQSTPLSLSTPEAHLIDAHSQATSSMFITHLHQLGSSALAKPTAAQLLQLMESQLAANSALLQTLSQSHSTKPLDTLLYIFKDTTKTLNNTLNSPLLSRFEKGDKYRVNMIVKAAHARHSVSGGTIDSLYTIATALRSNLESQAVDDIINPLLVGHFQFLLSADQYTGLASAIKPFSSVEPLTTALLKDSVESTIAEAQFSYQLQNPNSTPRTIDCELDFAPDGRQGGENVVAPSYLRYVLNELCKNCLHHAHGSIQPELFVKNQSDGRIEIKLVNGVESVEEPFPDRFPFGGGELYDRLKDQQSYASPQSDWASGMNVGIPVSTRLCELGGWELNVARRDDLMTVEAVLKLYCTIDSAFWVVRRESLANSALWAGCSKSVVLSKRYSQLLENIYSTHPNPTTIRALNVSLN